MTTEIAILNKSAVALAADSAVTLSNGNNEQKIYNSVNKLFSLSKCNPIGIMIYDNANIMGVPWETVIKSYRKKLGTRTELYLKDYVNDFIDFLKKDFFTEEIEDEYVENVIANQLNLLKIEVLKAVEKEIIKSGSISRKTTTQITNNLINPFYSNLVKQENIDNIIEKDFVENFLNKYKFLIEKHIKEILESIPISRESNEKLLKISALFFCKKAFIYNKTGVVIAGFGESEIYPSLYSLTIECSIQKNLKYQRDDEILIGSETEGCIVPFAQDSTIRTFMDGIDPLLEKFSREHIEKLFEKYTDAILNQIPLNDKDYKLLEQKIKHGNTALIDEYHKEMIQFKYLNHIEPILSAVEFLPKDELAAMAEALINITSLRKRISITPETVGGPVDVAIISKGDGFIWIKRKHYFQEQLNHQFFRNYFN